MDGVKAFLRSFAPAAAFAALALSSAPLRAQVVQPTNPPWKWLWVGSDNPVDTWGSANSRNGGALTGNWLLFPNDTPAPPITRPHTGSDLVVIDPAQSSQGTLGETITGELNCRMEPGASYSVGRLVMAAGTSLTLQGNSTLFITTEPAPTYATFAGAGSVTNHGDLRIGPGGYLSMAVAGTIDGNGTITLSPADATYGDATLGGNNNNTTLNLNGVTVRGAGQIRGGTNFPVILGNSGLIDANVAGKSIQIYTSGNTYNDSQTFPPSTNSGTFRASGGGTLLVSCFQTAGQVQNTGRFEALDGSNVRLDGVVTVVGGTFATAGSGSIRSAASFLKDVTNTGLLQVGNDTFSGEFLALRGTFTNSGTVRIGSAANLISAKLFLRNSLTLNGGGRLVLSSNDFGTVSAFGSDVVLTNPSGATIEGTGGIGFGSENGGLGSSGPLSLTNAGLVDANYPARGLTLRMQDSANARLTNSGTLRASGGGVLILLGIDANNEGMYDNTGGRIEALNASSVQIRSGAVVKGGTLATAGSGIVHLGELSQYNGGVLQDVLNTGRLELYYGTLAGTVTNTGVVSLTDGEAGFRSGAVFLNQAGATFASVNGTRLGGAGTFRNAGTFTRSGTSFSTMQAEVSFENTGTVVVDGFQQFGNFSQSAGTFRFGASATTQTASGQPFVFTGGSIVGSGSFQTAVQNNGSLTVGATDGTATALTFLGNFTQAANATLTVNVGGANAFGMLTVNGTATLAGTLQMALVNGFAFRAGDTFQLLSAGSVSGEFTSLSLPAGVSGTVTRSGGVLTLTITGAPAATSLVNISTRARVETGDNVLIGGFVIGGTASKRVIIRALGPSLTAFGVAGALSNPTLRLVNPATQQELASNDNWRGAQQAEIAASGFAPTNDNESAIVATLAPGSYTAVVSGLGGESGVGLIEVYDLDRTTRAAARPLNVSTRARVLTGDSILIGGFVVEGARERRVLIRALGPSLTAFGVPGALANPTLEVKDAAQATIGTNDDWKSTQQAAIAASGFAPPNEADSAIILTLAPGAYTALVRGVGGLTGVALVEVYDLE